MERIHEYLWKDWPDPALKLWRKFKDFMLRTFSDTLYKTVAAELREWRILPNVSLWSWDGKVRKHLFTLCHLWKIFSDNFRFIRWRQKVFQLQTLCLGFWYNCKHVPVTPHHMDFRQIGESLLKELFRGVHVWCLN